MWIVNLTDDDMYTLFCNPIHYDAVDINQAYKFQRTVRTTFAFGVHAGCEYWKKTRDLLEVQAAAAPAKKKPVSRPKMTVSRPKYPEEYFAD